MPARMSIDLGGPYWSHPVSSHRMNWTRTGFPTACDMSAAEMLTSS